MDRRTFVRLLAAVPLTPRRPLDDGLPQVRVVTPFRGVSGAGMPGPYPGTVVSVRSDRALDMATRETNAEVVRDMMARGMCALTGASAPVDAWRRLFDPSDIVGIKVNCGGYPHVVSDPVIVAETARQLMAVGIPAAHIYVYERFQQQLDEVNYGPRLPEGVQIVAAEFANEYTDSSGYDPATYVEADLFGEEDTRSTMMRLVTRRLTKIINIPNVKDHGAAGATGCLKNIAYGSFSNVARTHYRGRSHTYSFVGTLTSVEPLRSRTVLQIMDGLRGVWHGGPFARTRSLRLLPAPYSLRHRPCRHRSNSARHHRREAEGGRGHLDLGPVARLAQDGRHGSPRSRSQREHPHPRTRARGVRLEARAGPVRPLAHQGAGTRGMTRLAALVAIAWLQGVPPAALPCLVWTRTPEETLATLKDAGVTRVCVATELVTAWQNAGLEAVPLAATALASRKKLPAPGIDHRVDLVSATRSPWLNASGWRVLRHPQRAYRYAVKPDAAALAVAEAFAYGADVVVSIDPPDVTQFGHMSSFLRGLAPASGHRPVADFGVVDDGSEAMGEALNLLVRRNLLFELLDAPASRYPVNVVVGPSGFSRKDIADPSEFALRIRHQLTDAARTIRIYGSEVVICRVTGDAEGVRLHFLNYGGREIQGLRVRVGGRFRGRDAQVFGLGSVALEEFLVDEGASEFSIPRMTTYAVVDLESAPLTRLSSLQPRLRGPL